MGIKLIGQEFLKSFLSSFLFTGTIFAFFQISGNPYLKTARILFSKGKLMTHYKL